MMHVVCMYATHALCVSIQFHWKVGCRIAVVERDCFSSLFVSGHSKKLSSVAIRVIMIHLLIHFI